MRIGDIQRVPGWLAEIIQSGDGINGIGEKGRDFGRRRGRVECPALVLVDDELRLQHFRQGARLSLNGEVCAQLAQAQDDPLGVKELFDVLIGGIVYAETIGQDLQFGTLPRLELLMISLAEQPGINFESDTHVLLCRVGQWAFHRRLQRRSRDAQIERRILRRRGLITTDQ